MIPSKLVIYHANCIDGFTAAWVAWLEVGEEAEYIPAQYGDSPPDVTGRDVLIVDFSYPRGTLLKMQEQADTIRVLDHHKTAQAELAGLDFCTFDMDHSGARLAWDFLRVSKPPPIINYIEDRDLWRWALPESRKISAYIATIPRAFPDWSALDQQLILDLSGSAMMGGVALRVTEQYVETHREFARPVRIGGHIVPCLNTTFAASELVGALAEGQPFAAGWFQREDGRFVYSLRSRDGGLDVSEIARKYGGGGHRNAAGFTANELLPIEVTA